MLKLIALIVPLGLDSFAVCAALGLTRPTRQQQLRISVILPAFEVTMPLVGLGLGLPLGSAIGRAADYAAAFIVVVLGALMLFRAGEDEEARLAELGDRHGWTLILLGISISLDELAIGFSLGLLGLPVIPAFLLIGAQAVVFSQLGLRLGARLGERLREGAEQVAGLVLVAVGLVLLIEQIPL